MVKEIIKDEFFLKQKSKSCTKEDLYIANELLETIQAYKEQCVGMAANMIGYLKTMMVGTFCMLYKPSSPVGDSLFLFTANRVSFFSGYCTSSKIFINLGISRWLSSHQVPKTTRIW